MKYFKDHVPTSVFDNQAELASILNALGYRSIIESDEISPLTLRMFRIQNGLNQIESCVLSLRPLTFPVIFNQQGHYQGVQTNGELYGTQAPSGSVEYVHSYLTPRNQWNADPFALPPTYNYRFEQANADQIRIINDSSKVHTFSLHGGNYDFFVNLDSALDRIRLELNSIYFDGSKVLDKDQTKGCKYWYQYTDANGKCIKAMKSAGFTAISNVLTGGLSLSIDGRTGKYRNRLIHDGDLEVQIDKQSGEVFLPDDPLASPLAFSTELLPYVQSVFTDIQLLFKNIYAEIINDLKSKNKVPLI
jgi:hypothetical protein